MIARDAFLYLARQEGLKDFATRFSSFKQMTARFVAGENLEEATPVIRLLNERGCAATFDHLNESVENFSETKSEVQEYLKILRRIDETGIESNVSIKLTQFGLNIDRELAYQNVREVVAEAARRGNFVRIDMEGSAVTQATIDIAKQLRSEFGLNDIGIVLQSYLRRTEQDVRNMLKLPMRIRLCKGAYKEEADVAFPDKADVDRNFVKLSKILLSSGIYHGLATHDSKMIDACIDFVQKEKIKKDAFEFQLLYGIRRDLQEQLANDGYHVRVYVPYGKHWYPYFMRRLAERPANAWFLLKNMFKG